MDTDGTATGPIPPADDTAQSPDGDDRSDPTASRARKVVRTSATVVCWLLVAVFGAFAVMRVFGLERTWYLNTLVSFTPYVALLSVASVVVTAVARKWWATRVAGVICVTACGRAGDGAAVYSVDADPGATGSAVYSRYPLRDIGYRPLAGGFGQEYATVLVPGAQPLVVEAVHTMAPITLDHVFGDPRIGAASFGTRRVPGTDHKAIFATLTLPTA